MSSAGTKVTDKIPGLVRFSDGNALQFKVWAKQVESHLSSFHVYFHIDLTNMVLDANGDPVEAVFPGGARPCVIGTEQATATARLNAQIVVINTSLAVNVAMWNGLAIPVMQRVLGVAQATSSATTEIAHINNSSGKILKEVQDECKLWDDAFKKWQEQREKVATVFLGYCGTTALNLCRQYISADRLRMAWHVMIRHFTGQVGIVSGLNETHSMIDHLEFSRSKVGSASDHWSRLLELNELLVEGGENAISQPRLLDALFKAMERVQSGDGKIYLEDINFARKLNQDAQTVLSKFKEAESKQRMATPSGGTSSSSDAKKAKTAEVNAAKKATRFRVQQQYKKKDGEAVPEDLSNWCPFHKLSGHNADQCWSMHPELRPPNFKKRGAESQDGKASKKPFNVSSKVPRV